MMNKRQKEAVRDATEAIDKLILAFAMSDAINVDTFFELKEQLLALDESHKLNSEIGDVLDL